MKLLKTTAFTIFITSLISCSNNKSSDKTTGTEPAGKTEPTTTGSTAQPADDGKDGTVSFKVNDTLAQTKKIAKDTEVPIAMYTAASKFLSLSLMGDVPSRPHRGWLRVSITDEFKFEPATYSMNDKVWGSFTRYETENAGGATDFQATADEKDKGTSMTITFTKVEKSVNELGNAEYRVSGTFSAKMYNKVYEMKRMGTAQEVNISEGSFENIRLVGGPK